MSLENGWEELRKEFTEQLKEVEVGEEPRKEVSMEDFRSFFKELAAMVGSGRKVENRAEDKWTELVKATEELDSFK